MPRCEDCNGTRATPTIFGDLGPCLSCVIESDDGATWVVVETEEVS